MPEPAPVTNTTCLSCAMVRLRESVVHTYEDLAARVPSGQLLQCRAHIIQREDRVGYDLKVSGLELSDCLWQEGGSAREEHELTHLLTPGLDTKFHETR